LFSPRLFRANRVTHFISDLLEVNSFSKRYCRCSDETMRNCVLLSPVLSSTFLHGDRSGWITNQTGRLNMHGDVGPLLLHYFLTHSRAEATSNAPG
jgi:hypothetical protein